MKRRKRAKICYNWFWVRWFAEHASTSAKYQFTKFGRMTARDPKEGVKIILNFFFLTRKRVFRKKPKSTMKRRKRAKIFYIWFWVHWLPDHAPKSGKYQFAKFVWLTGRESKEVAKIILRLLFLSQRPPVLIKNQRELPHRGQWRQWLIFDFGHTGWQSTPQNLVNIDSPNFFGWLEQTLRKRQKLFWSYSF